MGWISDRHMREGGTIGKPPQKGDRILKAPLVNISYIIYHASDMFARNTVMLECGHKAYTNGMYKARCKECLKIKEQEEG